MSTEYPVFLSGPREATGAALVLSAKRIPSPNGEMQQLRRHLVEVTNGTPPCWRSEPDYGIFSVAGPRDLDITPFLRKLAEWLDLQEFTVKILVTDSGDERFKQIRSVFPDAAFNA